MIKIYGIYDKNGQCVTVGTINELKKYLKSTGMTDRGINYVLKKRETNRYIIEYIYSEKESKDEQI